MEDDAAGVLFLEAEGLEKVPGNGFSLAVFIGCEPYGMGSLGCTLEFGNKFLLFSRDNIVRLEPVFNVYAQVVLLKISDMPPAGQHFKIVSEKLFDRSGLCRRLNYY